MYKALKLSVLLLCTFSGTSQAELCETTLTLGLGNIWPPYYFEENSQPAGADIDIVQLIFAEANICLNYRKMPSSARALLELKNGNIDFLYAASFSEERAKIATFSAPYRHETVRIFWRANGLEYLSSASLKSLFLSGLIVATNRGSFIGKKADKILKMQNNAAVISVPTIEQRMMMLTHQRVDFIIEDEIAGLYYIHREKIKDIKLHPHVIYQDDISLMFSRKVSQQTITLINTVIEQNGKKIDKIIESYVNKN